MQKHSKLILRLSALVLTLAFVVTLVLLGGNLPLAEPDNAVQPNPFQVQAEQAPVGRTEEELLQETEPPETEPTEPEETTPPTDPSEPEDQTDPEETVVNSEETVPDDQGEQTKPTDGDSESEQTRPTEGEGEEQIDPTAPSNPISDENKPRIVTSLYNRTITFDDLEDDNFSFTAYLVNGEEDMYLRVRLRNSNTSFNGTMLTGHGRNYDTVLAREEENYITLYVRQGDDTVLEQSYVISYQARPADENNPTVGQHPPTIHTSLDNVSRVDSSETKLDVVARTYQGKPIPASNVEVWLDGVPVKNPVGSDTLTYTLFFRQPDVGDSEKHVITIRVRDGMGSSTYYKKEITYDYIDIGSERGTVSVVIDATTVGLWPGDLADTFIYTIHEGDKASHAVLAALQDAGFDVTYGGTVDSGFYLRRISRAGMADYAEIPDNLWNKILADGIPLTGSHYSGSLGEHDYTQGAGWLYCVDGVLSEGFYPGEGLSERSISNGQTIRLCFTLAYGKDVGGYTTTGGSYGVLSTYCGVWLYGSYQERHSWGDEEQVSEPDCTQDGLVIRKCAVCGDVQEVERIPALGHAYEITDQQAPTDQEDGWNEHTCSICGDSWREVVPKVEPPVTEPSEPAPSDPPPNDEENEDTP